MGRYRRLRSLFREALSNRVVVAAQGAGDAERFRSLGADPERTHVTGNIKFDFAVPPEREAQGRRAARAVRGGRPVWVAGSTHRGEEAVVLEAHRDVRKAHPGAILVLVPRHPQRFNEVASWLESAERALHPALAAFERRTPGMAWKCCSSIRSASCWISTRWATSRSSAARWSRWADTTCSSRRRWAAGARGAAQLQQRGYRENPDCTRGGARS